MSVASLELCKELYELSDWQEPLVSYCWERLDGKLHDGVETSEWIVRQLGTNIKPEDTPYPFNRYPAYDLGYLLRKLPIYDPRNNGRPDSLTLDIVTNGWACGYGLMAPASLKTYGDIPEDAACNLAIELFKQGIL